MNSRLDLPLRLALAAWRCFQSLLLHAEPNAVGKDGKPDLANLRQLQIIGDWAGGKAVDVEVDAVLLTLATAEVRAARAAREKRLVEEAEKLRRERTALQAKYGQRTDNSPTAEHVCAVAPDMLAIEIQAGRLIPVKLVKYEAQPGDMRGCCGRALAFCCSPGQ